MKKNSIEQITQQILTFYNEYDLRVSGKINSLTAFQLVEAIEKKYQTDLIQLSDGTKLWNLLRDFLYSNFGAPTPAKKLTKNTIKSTLTILKDGVKPLHLPKNITVCGFSSEESRKLLNDTYYDIFLDGQKRVVLEENTTNRFTRGTMFPCTSPVTLGLSGSYSSIDSPVVKII
jgi:hypothetical protein